MKIQINGPCTIEITGDAEIINDEPTIPIPTPVPEVPDWISVDPHCHFTGCPTPMTVDELAQSMIDEDVHVATPLIWGLGLTNPLIVTSTPGRVIRCDCEYSQTPSYPLGHLITHGCMKHPTQMKKYTGLPTASTIPIAEWARANGAVAIGMAHCSNWPEPFPNDPNPEWAAGYPPTAHPINTIPYEAIPLAVLGLLDYLGVETPGTDGRLVHPGALNLWKHLTKAGFKIGLVGGSDYSCISENKSIGKMRTMVRCPDGHVSYGDAMQRLRRGATVVSRGKNGVLDLWIENNNGTISEPGGPVSIALKTNLAIIVETDQPGPVELLLDGSLWTSIPLVDGRGEFMTPPMGANCTISARTTNFHTSGIYVTVLGTSSAVRLISINWLLGWMDRLERAVTAGRFGDGAKGALPYYTQARAVLESKR